MTIIIILIIVALVIGVGWLIARNAPTRKRSDDNPMFYKAVDKEKKK